MMLYGESFSPWTKKARWALELCRVGYDYREYTPTLSEPGLRLRLGQWTGQISVPLLIAADGVRRGSWAIARLADERAGDNRLGDFARIETWDALSEDALAEGRTRVVRSVLASPAALAESLPAFVPSPLRRPLRVIARYAAQRLDRKYAHLVKPGALREALAQTRAGLADSDSDYLLGEFSYADVTMAVVLETIAPIARTEPPLGPAVAACWHDTALADEFADLVAWRDRLAANPATRFSQFDTV